MLAYPHANQVRDFFMAMDSRRVAQGLEELSVHEATALTLTLNLTLTLSLTLTQP